MEITVRQHDDGWLAETWLDDAALERLRGKRLVKRQRCMGDAWFCFWLENGGVNLRDGHVGVMQDTPARAVHVLTSLFCQYPLRDVAGGGDPALQKNDGGD